MSGVRDGGYRHRKQEGEKLVKDMRMIGGDRTKKRGLNVDKKRIR